MQGNTTQNLQYKYTTSTTNRKTATHQMHTLRMSESESAIIHHHCALSQYSFLMTHPCLRMPPLIYLQSKRERERERERSINRPACIYKTGSSGLHVPNRSCKCSASARSNVDAKMLSTCRPMNSFRNGVEPRYAPYMYDAPSIAMSPTTLSIE